MSKIRDLGLQLNWKETPYKRDTRCFPEYFAKFFRTPSRWRTVSLKLSLIHIVQMLLQTEKMLREENVFLIKSGTKLWATYTTFSSRDFLFFVFARLLIYATFSRVFFLRNLFFKVLETKKTTQWGMNERFKYVEFYVFF